MLAQSRKRILLSYAGQAGLSVIETLILDMLMTDNPPNEDDSGRWIGARIGTVKIGRGIRSEPGGGHRIIKDGETSKPACLNVVLCSTVVVGLPANTPVNVSPPDAT